MIFIEITYGNSKVTVEVKCRFCNQLDYVKKHGKGSMQHQRYRCQQCNKTFQLDYIYHACRPGIKEQIIDLAMNNALKVLLICEVDKMWSFVRGKKLQSWLWYAWEPDLKCIIVHAFGDRSDTLNILLTHLTHEQIFALRLTIFIKII